MALFKKRNISLLARLVLKAYQIATSNLILTTWFNIEAVKYKLFLNRKP